MKFQLFTVGYEYSVRESEDLEKIGFVFRLPQDGGNYRIIDAKHTPELEIGTLEELIEFINRFGEIILNGRSIKIYDGYVE